MKFVEQRKIVLKRHSAPPNDSQRPLYVALGALGNKFPIQPSLESVANKSPCEKRTLEGRRPTKKFYFELVKVTN